VYALAAGKKAAKIIDRYLRGEELIEPRVPMLPDVYIEPADTDPSEFENAERAEPELIPAEARKKNFREVEIALRLEQAIAEARRCLRCDLEFTRGARKEAETEGAKDVHV
jgi:hypothetical protein